MKDTTLPNDVWAPRPTDAPRRGSTHIHAYDPEPVESIPDRISTNRRTLACRDGAHGVCKGKMYDFDYQFRRPTEDPCGCTTCHTKEQ